MSIPKRAAERIIAGLKRYHAVLSAQRDRDVSEADTVTLVKDLLSEVFGYDKYAELTSEHSIRSTYCDLAVKIDGTLALLIEVKSIGIDLKDNHVRQAIDYAANQGCEWVVLTNALEWRLYHVLFQKPINKKEIARLNLLTVNPRNDEDMERLFLITREGFTKSALAEYRDKKDATSRFLLAAILTESDGVIGCVRREVRRVSGISVEPEVIARLLRDEVVKREALEGEYATAASRRYSRAADSPLRKTKPETRRRRVSAVGPAPASPTPTSNNDGQRVAG